MQPAISCRFCPRPEQSDFEGLQCEENFSKEKAQTYDGREHGENK
jgi:hypothetical protein